MTTGAEARIDFKPFTRRWSAALPRWHTHFATFSAAC